MKTVVLALVLAATLVAVLGEMQMLPEEQQAKLREYQESCIHESAVDPSVLQAAKHGKLDETDEKLACFATCLLKKVEMMDADGNIDWETARAKAQGSFSQEQIDRTHEKCKDISGVGCRKGADLLKCIIVNAINENFFSGQP